MGGLLFNGAGRVDEISDLGFSEKTKLFWKINKDLAALRSSRFKGF